MEVKREPRSYGRLALFESVSILVLMEVKREFPFQPVDGLRSWVSILVLMEVKREALLGGIVVRKPIRFNPCFDGSEARG